ncbi:MAG: Gmad2 immunoglobulin-like domain-containing protein [Parcubacteria group bacterium]
MKQSRVNLWIGFTIGLLAALLLAALAILFVPRLRPIVGIDSNKVINQSNTVNTLNETSNEPATRNEPVRLESENIYVSSPAPYARISNPVEVAGGARVFENTVSVRLRDGDGSVLAESFATADSPDVGLFGPFELNLSYRKPSFATGKLEFFQQSAKDGSEQDLVTIPVEFGTD